MSDVIVEVNNVSMLFNMSKERVDNLKEYVIRFLKGQLIFQEFWALKNISLNIHKGEALGIIGFNGSGKSTLLKLIAGVLKPTKGTIRVYGSVAPMIELSAGFDQDLSARENVFLNGAMLGINKAFLREKFDEIIEFAELREFVDVPIKNFSSGMVARLGFSIATIRKPDVLIVDEALEVGDYKFKLKCEKRINEIIANGATVILVSHSMASIKKICNKVAWIHKGELVKIGDTAEVCDAFLNYNQ